MKKIIGIDLGGTSVKLALVSPDGTIMDQWHIPTHTENGGKHIVPDIIESVREYLDANDLSASDIQGIGMGSPGQIDPKKGTVTGAYNLGWADTQEVQSQFEEAFDIPFVIDNDANVAALGEQWQGAGENDPNVIFVTLGTGVGGGIVLGGELVHGAAGSAGEIGHIVVDPNGYECTCGNRGCLETVASATGIVRLAKAEAKRQAYDSPLNALIADNNISAKAVFDAAKSGDNLALVVVDQFADYLGLACSQLANTLNPNKIVVGGGVSAAGGFLLEKVNAKFQQYAFSAIKGSTELVLASLGNDAGILGAASLVREEA
ncbi:MAG: ROK family glucokinase [Aerococcus sp.]|nr:ROK family glucokinase [Aerococcus sp.]